MKKVMKIVLLLLIVQMVIFTLKAQEIKVKINLQQETKDSLLVEVELPKSSNTIYSFPKSIPGTYDIGNFGKYIHNPRIINQHRDTIAISKGLNEIFLAQYKANKLLYSFHQLDTPMPFVPEECLLNKNCQLLNWNCLVGFLENSNASYTITIIKNKDLVAKTSMKVTHQNDSIDVFQACNYLELVQSPVFYTNASNSCSFNIGESTINISTNTSNSKFDPHILQKYLKPSIEKAFGASVYKPKQYDFFFIQTALKLIAQGFGGLEKDYSTIITVPKYEIDTCNLKQVSIHELCHSLFSPLFIRSNTLGNFNFSQPKCDQHLWFYEGVDEYISAKLCMQSGGISKEEFIRTIHEAHVNSKNSKLLSISEDVYSKKGQKYYMDVYTKGYLLGCELDMLILEKTEGKQSLLSTLQKLQNRQMKHGDFDENHFFTLLSELTGVDLDGFQKRIDSKKKFDFEGNTQKLGYRLEVLVDLTKSRYIFPGTHVTNFQKNEHIISKSPYNKENNCKKMKIFTIDNQKITEGGVYLLNHPENKEYTITYKDKLGEIKSTKIKPLKSERPMYKRLVSKLKQGDWKYQKQFWIN